MTIIGISFWIDLVWNEYQLSESIMSFELLSMPGTQNQVYNQSIAGDPN